MRAMFRPVVLVLLAAVLLVAVVLLLRGDGERVDVAHAPVAPAPVASGGGTAEVGTCVNQPPSDDGKAAARVAVPAATFEVTPEVDALLARAASDPDLALVTAEVRAVGPIAPKGSQDFDLFVLATGAATPRRYALVRARWLPKHARSRFGITTEPGSVVVGEVRTFVLAKGRPDLGPFGTYAGMRGAFWLTLVGPVVPRPEDPVLARVPAELMLELGRPGTNVFRGRVVGSRRVGESGKTALQHLARVDPTCSRRSSWPANNRSPRACASPRHRSFWAST
jgi:hypothetical protein